MRQYRQLTEDDRIDIDAMKQAGKSQTQMAHQLGVHRSTIRVDPDYLGPAVSHERIYQYL